MNISLSKLFLIFDCAFLHFCFGDSFNCPSDCGIYGAKDRTGPRLHNLCTSMSEAKCKEESFKSQSTKMRLQNRGNKIVGGLKSKHPMPWMAVIRMGNKHIIVIVPVLFCRSNYLWWICD